MAAYPVPARFVVSARLSRTDEIWFAAPLFPRQEKCFLEKVLLAVYIFGYGIGTVYTPTEPRPLFGTQPPPVVTPVWICP